MGAAGEESNELGPRPQRYGRVGEALRKPSLGLLTVYLSQYEGDDRIPDRANQLFRFNVMQSMGQQLRHDHLQYYFQTLQPVSLGLLYDKSLLVTKDEPGLASLLCHNHTRSLGVREPILGYEDMALPWKKIKPWGNDWVKYKARSFDPIGSSSEQTYTFRRDAVNASVFERNGQPSAFYLLHKPDEILETHHPNDWYHFFITQTITAFHSTECIVDEAAPDWSDDSWTLESVALYYVLKWLVGLLREANPDAEPDDHHYAGWLWANAMSFMEGLFYEEPQNQADSTRESRIHCLGALSGINQAIGILSIMPDGEMPTWRWYVPKAIGLRAEVEPVLEELESAIADFSAEAALAALMELGDKLAGFIDTIEPYVEQILDVNGNLIPDGIHSENSTSASELASQILSNDQIALATAHSEGPNDNATAYDNMVDTANGLEAARSNYGNAPGETVPLDPQMLAALLGLADIYSFAISELAGGSHSPTSRHYAGVAADINVINDEHVGPAHPDVADFMQMCRDWGATEVLGPGDEDHYNHVHAAWPRPQ